MKKRILHILLLSSTATWAQSQVLTFDTFMEWVGSRHPLAKSANVQVEIGEASVTAARGSFDPMAFASVNQKTYDEVNYYNRELYGVELPTWGGLSFNTLFERNTGAYLNPEKNVPQSGLFSAGMRVNLGQGLMIDERRKALWQSKAFEQQSVEQQRIELNNLYLDAAKTYWLWVLSNQNYEVLERGLAVSTERFRGIRASFLAGELPAIDTIEAYAQLQNISIQLKEQEIQRYYYRQIASAFLWNDDLQPMDLDSTTYPESLEEIERKGIPSNLIAELDQHPELELLRQQREILDIERRWKAEQIKPTLFVQYNALTSSFGDFEQQAFFQNNYAMGGGFSIPLFLRKERGNLRIAKAQLKQTDFDLVNTSARLMAGLMGDINELKVTGEQMNIAREMVYSLQRLLLGEQQRFELGESSIFLINNRENMLLNGKISQNQIRAQWMINRAKVINSAGKAWAEF